MVFLKMRGLIGAVAIALAVSGCTTLADARLAEGSGTKKTFNAGYEQVWDATLKSVKSVGLEVASEDKSKGQIMAQGGVSAFSWGENVAVFVLKKDSNATEVEVVSKRALATNVTASDWSDDILEKIPTYLPK